MSGLIFVSDSNITCIESIEEKKFCTYLHLSRWDRFSCKNLRFLVIEGLQPYHTSYNKYDQFWWACIVGECQLMRACVILHAQQEFDNKNDRLLLINSLRFYTSWKQASQKVSILYIFKHNNNSINIFFNKCMMKELFIQITGRRIIYILLLLLLL